MWEFIPLAVILLLFWFMVVRPQRRQARDVGQLQSSLNEGDEVMLTSGFYGTLQGLHDDRVDVELAPGVVVAVARGAIASVVQHDLDTPTPTSLQLDKQLDAGHDPDVSKEG